MYSDQHGETEMRQIHLHWGVPSTAAYNCQQACDWNLQKIRKKREMTRQLEDEEALLEEANKILFQQIDLEILKSKHDDSIAC